MTAAATTSGTSATEAARELLSDLAPPCEFANVSVSWLGRPVSARCPNAAEWIAALTFRCGASDTRLACQECSDYIRRHQSLGHPGGVLNEPYTINRLERI